MNGMTIGTATLIATAPTLTGSSASTQAVIVGDAPAATTSAAHVAEQVIANLNTATK